MYSKKYPTTAIIFRDFEAGLVFDWHNAPQPQYIIYLEGQVEVEASGGQGHITRTFTTGRSAVITTE